MSKATALSVSPKLTGENIVRVHGRHAPDCAHGCGGSFVCAECKHRYGWCLQARDKNARLCLRCEEKRLKTTHAGRA